MRNAGPDSLLSAVGAEKSLPFGHCWAAEFMGHGFPFPRIRTYFRVAGCDQENVALTFTYAWFQHSGWNAWFTSRPKVEGIKPLKPRPCLLIVPDWRRRPLRSTPFGRGITGMSRRGIDAVGSDRSSRGHARGFGRRWYRSNLIADGRVVDLGLVPRHHGAAGPQHGRQVSATTACYWYRCATVSQHRL